MFCYLFITTAKPTTLDADALDGGRLLGVRKPGAGVKSTARRLGRLLGHGAPGSTSGGRRPRSYIFDSAEEHGLEATEMILRRSWTRGPRGRRRRRRILGIGRAASTFLAEARAQALLHLHRDDALLPTTFELDAVGVLLHALPTF